MVVSSNITSQGCSSRLLLLRNGSWGRNGSWSKYVGWSDKKLKTQLQNKGEETETDDIGLSAASAASPKKLLHVVFNEDANEVNEIPVRTEEEHELCWYHEPDYESFEKDRALTGLHYHVRKRKCKSIDHELYCIRGLEEICDYDLKKKRIAEQSLLKKRILEEQQNQKESSSNANVKNFREISLRISCKSRQRAINAGKDDYRYVVNEYNDYGSTVTNHNLQAANNKMLALRRCTNVVGSVDFGVGPRRLLRKLPSHKTQNNIPI